MSITTSSFGTLPTGEEVSLFTLANANGLRAEITNYGGIIVGLHVPSRDGELSDIVLGKDSLQGYLDGHPYFGCITGRVAGRIRDARFCMDGVDYVLVQNDEANCLHGGDDGYDRQLWDASIIEANGAQKLQLQLTELDGHNNFPGTVHSTVTYAVLEDDTLEICYTATTDKSTPLNLTNHSYFNLAGHDSGNVLNHEVQILADTVSSVDEVSTLIGRKDPVAKGFNDYREPVALKELESLEVSNADIHFNHPDGRTEAPKLIASVYEPNSGRVMDVLTTEPGVQFYAALTLGEETPESGKNGHTYTPKTGLCMETQDYADTVNFPDMGGAILQPDEVFESTTLYKFSTRT